MHDLYIIKNNMEAEANEVLQTDEIAHPLPPDNNNDNNVEPKRFDKNTAFIYASHFLSSFGDRVWHFAVGLFLFYLSPCTLLLTGIHGLSTCISLFLLGAPIGRWVDKSERLKAAGITLVMQNTAVVTNATIMAITFYYKAELRNIWNGYFIIAIYASIILMEVVSELASMANKLALEKDWIVVLAKGDEQKLSRLNATMRTINLTCKLMAPFFVGHLLEWFSYLAGAIFIGCWNLVSGVVEYYLLHLIFSLVPELSHKKKYALKPPCENLSSKSEKTDNIQPNCSNSNSNKKLEEGNVMGENSNGTNNNEQTSVPIGPTGADEIMADFALTTTNNNDIRQTDNQCICQTSRNWGNVIPEERRKQDDEENNNNLNDSDSSNEQNKKARFWSSFDGWKVYFSHSVKFAGLALASLYMTVLSFDNVTIGYLSSQGVGSGLTGNLTAASALIGILGSVSFPFIRKRLGKSKTGMLGFGLESICLLLCVISIIGPGSTFNPGSVSNIFKVGITTSCGNKTERVSLSLEEQWQQHPNIFLLMAGIVSARYGLWIADLSVTQIFQENVGESQRGVMGGVQGSLNQLMSLIKFVLTVLFPDPTSFGYLVCLSWLFVFFGFVLFSVYVCVNKRVRAVRPCGCRNNANVQT